MSVLKRFNGSDWIPIGPPAVKTNNSQQIKNNSRVNGTMLTNALDNLNNTLNNLESTTNNVKQEIEQSGFEPNENLITDQVNTILNSKPQLSSSVQNHSLTLNKFASSSVKYVTPEQYGAVGDGETDDSLAIQGAIDSCYPVFFTSNKTYIVTELLLWQGCILYGNGATLKRPNLKETPYEYDDETINSSYMINCELNSQPGNIEYSSYDGQIEIRDLVFDCNGFSMWDPTSGTSPYSTGYCIRCSGNTINETLYWENVLIDNCSFKNGYAPCVFSNEYVNLTMNNCYINDSYGIYINKSSNKVDLNNIKYNSNYDWTAFTTGGISEEENPVIDININNCTFFGGIDIYGIMPSPIYNINISNSYIVGKIIIFQLQNENCICKINNSYLKNENTGFSEHDYLGTIKISGNGTIIFESCNIYTVKGILLTGGTLDSLSNKIIINNCYINGVHNALQFYYKDPLAISMIPAQKKPGHFKVFINNCYFNSTAFSTINITGPDFSTQEFDYCYISNCIFNKFDNIISCINSAPVFNNGNNIIPISSKNTENYIVIPDKTIFKDEIWESPVPVLSQNITCFGSRTMYTDKLPSSGNYLNNVDIIQLTTDPYKKYKYINNEWVQL